jgi:hypothetical protein
VAFLAVKDWPWWRLLGSLRPRLSATIGTEQLRAKEVGPRGGVATPSPAPSRTETQDPARPGRAMVNYCKICRTPKPVFVLFSVAALGFELRASPLLWRSTT